MYKLRDAQKTVLKKAEEAISAGKKHIFIESPTGTGKSIIGLELARRYQKNCPERNTFLLTAEKILQKQYEETVQDHKLEGITSISGIDNYKCHLNNEKFSLGVCRSMNMGNRKALDTLSCATSCEYLQKWVSAQAAPVAVFNYSYYFIQMNYVLRKMEAHAPFQARPLIIADEAHKLPDLLEEHFHATIDREWVSKIKECTDRLREDEVYVTFTGAQWGVLAKLISSLFKVRFKDKADQLKELKNIYNFLVDLREKISESKIQLQRKYKIDLGEGDANDVFTAWQESSQRVPSSVYHFNRLADELKDYTCKIEDYIEIINNFGLDAMVISSDDGRRLFRIFNDQALFEKFYKPHGEVFIYMSATLQPEVLIKRLGIPMEEAEIIRVQSGWDAKKSPIHTLSTANFSFINKDAVNKSIKDIDNILKKHKNE